jgi:hypothetical protein
MNSLLLNLEFPERNPDRMMTFGVNNIEVDKELIDLITIYKPLFVARDYKKAKAILQDDGDRFLVTKPTVPFFMIKEVMELHSLVEGKHACKAAYHRLTEWWLPISC